MCLLLSRIALLHLLSNVIQSTFPHSCHEDEGLYGDLQVSTAMLLHSEDIRDCLCTSVYADMLSRGNLHEYNERSCYPTYRHSIEVHASRRVVLILVTTCKPKSAFPPFDAMTDSLYPLGRCKSW